jgi:hypothetical protein
MTESLSEYLVGKGRVLATRVYQLKLIPLVAPPPPLPPPAFPYITGASFFPVFPSAQASSNKDSPKTKTHTKPQ